MLALAQGRSLDLCQELGEFARTASDVGLPCAAVVDPGMGAVGVRFVGPWQFLSALSAALQGAGRDGMCVVVVGAS